MDRRDFIVKYHGVRLEAGESLHLPDVRGILTVFPAPDCDAALLSGTQTVAVRGNQTLFIAQNALTVTGGTLSGDLIFCANAGQPCN